MDCARDRITGHLVDAEQLWLIDPVDKTRYVCRGCGISVSPASYGRDNLVRPYFTVGKKPHPNCDVAGEQTLISRAKTSRISDPRSGFPGSYPNVLDLQDTSQVVNTPLGNADADSRPTPSKSHASGPGGRHDRTNKYHTARTIRTICSHFANYPFDRDMMRLSIPGISGTTYEQVFWRVKNDAILRYKTPHLFYAPIRWAAPEENGQHLEIQLSAGEWVDRTLKKPYRVRVEWDSWSPVKRNCTRREIDVARKEAIAANKRHGKEKGWLFFVGKQDASDESLFIVNDYRLVCCLVVEMTYPNRH